MGGRVEAFGLALLAFLTFALFTPQFPANDQIVTRLGLTLSIVERGELTIDRFADRTIDKAEVGGHVYADKAPGLSLLAVPSVAIARSAFTALGLSTDARDRDVFARYALVATLATNGIISALAVAALFLASLRLGTSRGAARFAATALAVGTPFLGWSTAFFAHALSASLLTIIFAIGAVAFAGEPPRLRQHPVWLGLLLGLLMGFAVLTDFTTAPLVGFGGLLVLVLAGRRGQLLPVLVGLAVGGGLGLLPLVVYNQLAFGSPFILGYAEVKLFTGMREGLFGITWPDPEVARELLVGEYRGLLPLAPVLLLAPFGLLRMFARRPARIAALVIVVAVATFLWINAGYFYWKGGNSTGPRFLVPMIPFLCLTLAFAWPRGWLRAPVLLLLAVSAAISLATASVTMFAPENDLQPLRGYFLDRLGSAELLKGALALTAWVLLWIIAAMVDRRMAAAPTAAGAKPAAAS